MAGFTDNTVLIRAPMDLVWDMTNDVTTWPSLFTEYARADVLSRDGDTVRFRLTMHPDENGKQWTWVSERTADARTRTVTARRVEAGPFEYMNIRWEYLPAGDGVLLHWTQEFAMKPTAPVDDSQAQRRLNEQTQKEQARIKVMVEQAAGHARRTPLTAERA